MDTPASREIFLFEGFRLDRADGRLFRENGSHDGEPLTLGSRAAALLGLLVERQGKLVTKDEIFATVWPGMAVEEANLTVQISTLRRILDRERRQRESCIQTVPGRGYRLVTAVTRVAGTVRPETCACASDKPSIAVLSFINLSGDLEQEYFADGIAEDIITGLSRYPSLFVIARNSSFAYKGRAVDVKQIGCELGARYVVEGSLRKSGNRIRVTAQLVDTELGKHIWAERYDRELADLFAVQDDVTVATTTAIAPAIAVAERQRAMRMHPGSLDAWAAYQRGLWHFYKISPQDNALAQKYFQHAIDIDPNFAAGYKGLAWIHIQAAGVYGTRTLPEACDTAEALARRAVALDPTDAEAYSALSQSMLYSRGDYEGALAEAEIARAISPNLALAHGTLGEILIFSGRPKEGLAAVQTALRLDPYDPKLANRLNNLAVAFYFSKEYEAALASAKRAVRANPDFALAYRWLAASLGQLGRTAEAKKALEKAVTIAPATFDMYVRQRVPWHRQQDYNHMLDGLSKAGWNG